MIRNLFVFCLVSISSFAHAADKLELACWDIYSAKGSRPYFTASVGEGQKLYNAKLNKKNQDGWDSNLEIPNEAFLAPTLITSNRSPYKGNNSYDLVNAELRLPADLTPANLKEKIKTGIGMGAGENAVIIGTMADGDGAGSHYSIRMRCSSK